MAIIVEVDTSLWESMPTEEAIPLATRQPAIALRTAIDRATRPELLEGLAMLAHRIAVTEPREDGGLDDDVFLSTRELSKRIPYTKGSLYTLLSLGRFVEGHHYLKKGNRIHWSWRAMKAWVMSNESTEETTTPVIEPISQHTRRRRT